MTKLTRKRFIKKTLEKIKHHLSFQDSDGNWQNKAPKKYFATNIKGLCLSEAISSKILLCALVCQKNQ